MERPGLQRQRDGGARPGRGQTGHRGDRVLSWARGQRSRDRRGRGFLLRRRDWSGHPWGQGRKRWKAGRRDRASGRVRHQRQRNRAARGRSPGLGGALSGGTLMAGPRPVPQLSGGTPNSRPGAEGAVSGPCAGTGGRRRRPGQRVVIGLYPPARCHPSTFPLLDDIIEIRKLAADVPVKRLRREPPAWRASISQDNLK